MAFAHSPNGLGQWHELVDHLTAVAELTGGFADFFGSHTAGYYLGLWHDLGKFDPKWQEYLLANEAGTMRRGHGPDHKGAGSWLAAQHLNTLALIVHGHHGGLKSRADSREWIKQRPKDAAAMQSLALARAAIPDLEPQTPVLVPPWAEKNPHAAEMYLRMLFSALVDADSLDTEAHDKPDKSAQRGWTTPMAELTRRFDVNQAEFADRPDTPVNRVRQEIYDHCLVAAELPPGLFRLTVPTGGGKTRSGMAFALHHALRHGLRQIVVAVPFLTITDQTSATYRSIFEGDGGEPVVLEHHSLAAHDEPRNAADADADEDFAPGAVWGRLASENWDAPITVTTTVQLFESLFARGRTRTRKLHRLARSVIILDEVQSLPTDLLTPILDVLKDLCDHYGTTIIFSTATQPGFEVLPVFRAVEAQEIVPDPGHYFAELRRVRYDWQHQRKMTWDEVADLLRGETQMLAVLNTKADALALLDALADSNALHLSTLLCGAHRRAVITEVQRRLQAGEPCRLITTQVVEAGVDLDFPVVARALGPLDSIIQVAGRCNREGRRSADDSRVIIFDPAEGRLPGSPAYKIATNETITRANDLLAAGGDGDPNTPAVLATYYRRIYDVLGQAGTDAGKIQERRAVLDYPEVAARFRMIDDDTESVVITSYGTEEERNKVRDLLERLRRKDKGDSPRLLLRQLQPYMVNVRRRFVPEYTQRGLIVPVMPGVGEWFGQYDRVRGVIPEPPPLDTLFF